MEGRRKLGQPSIESDGLSLKRVLDGKSAEALLRKVMGRSPVRRGMDWLTPCCREKLLANRIGNRTKTDTGRMVENTKARERTPVKELGNLAP